MAFFKKDGKIITTGEYFDATGMVNAVGPVQRNVVVATLRIKEGNYEKVQEMLDLEEGLKTTRNYDGCTHLESFFNKESSRLMHAHTSSPYFSSFKPNTATSRTPACSRR